MLIYMYYFGPNPGIVNQLVDREVVWRLLPKNSVANFQVLRLDQHSHSFTSILADLDTEELLNIICNTLQNWLGCRLHDYVELQNLNLIIQNLIASYFEGLALQYAISRVRDVLFTIRSNWTSVRAVLQKTIRLSILALLLCPLILSRPQRGQLSRSRSRSRYVHTRRPR